jgi:hypothetical protein
VSRALERPMNEQRHDTTMCNACGQMLPIKAGPLLCAECEQLGTHRLASVYGKSDKRPLCSEHGYASWVTGRAR